MLAGMDFQNCLLQGKVLSLLVYQCGLVFRNIEYVCLSKLTGLFRIAWTIGLITVYVLREAYCPIICIKRYLKQYVKAGGFFNFCCV